ncbi:aminoacyl-tRNA deacylase [Chloroflexota bacterium]
MTTVNNITRMLDAKNVEYTAHVLPVEKLGAQEAAEIIGVDPAVVFKTIVVKRLERGKPILAVVPGDSEVDLKAVAKAVGEKKVKLTTQNEAEGLTGLKVGGISPLALLNKGFQTVVDEAALSYETIFISGGQRGLNLQLAPNDIIQLTQARTGKISRSN